MYKAIMPVSDGNILESWDDAKAEEEARNKNLCKVFEWVIITLLALP